MPLLTEQGRRKRNLLVITAFLLLVAVASTVNLWTQASQLPLASNIAVFALFNVNLIVLLVLVVLLFRNLAKLWLERRQKLIGSRFKTKLVLVFLLLALAPSILIFLIASNFINKSIEGWFTPQVERPLDQALSVAQTYYQNLQTTALRQAHHIGRVIDRDNLLSETRREALAAYLVEQQEQLGFSTITIFGPNGQELVHVQDPGLGNVPVREVNESQLRLGLAGQSVTTVREVATGDLIEAVAPVFSRRGAEPQLVGAVVVGTHVAERLEAKVRGIAQAFQEYKQLKLVKTPIKGIYILLFLLMTLIIVFSFSWFGLSLARGITGPIAELAEGTREVAAGNLSYKVKARADDEIGVLVDSFNRMTDDLGESKRRLEEAYLDLQDKHAELEDRRRYMETVLEAITTGVLSLDAQDRVTTLNRAAAAMFGLDGPGSGGRPAKEVFASPDLVEVTALIDRVRRARGGSVEQEVHLRRNGAGVTLLGSATLLRGPDGSYAGVVAVFDDLTDLLTAQRLAAWREVAQRIAHEIKNPLTPIQLSAQRLRRRLARVPDERELVAECTETIIQEVDGLRRLVDEFSRFARMPALAPRPTDLRALVDSVVGLYRDSRPSLKLATECPANLPSLDVDPDHIKRALLNLVDNAVEAVGGTGEVRIDVVHLADSGRIQLIVSDTGPGIAREHRDRLFLPYFSTKPGGMGLGLPIVHEIATEHGGSIRVEDNTPRGSRFVFELPVTRTATAIAV